MNEKPPAVRTAGGFLLSKSLDKEGDGRFNAILKNKLVLR
jgi:hypothetical protein